MLNILGYSDYTACPLCQRDVDPLQTNYYRVLSLDSEKTGISDEKPVCDEFFGITIGGLFIDPGLCYPVLA